MRRSIVFFLIALVAAVSTTDISAAEKREFEKVANLPGVEFVYVGSAAFRMMGSSNILKGMSGVPSGITGSLQSIKSMEVLECDNAASKEYIKAAIEKIVRENSLEMILETNEYGDTTRIYAHVPEEDAPLKDLLIENSEKDEYNVVYIKGTIDVAALQQLNVGD